MDSETHVIKAGSIAHDRLETNVNIECAGWEWSSIRVLALPAGRSEMVASGISEPLVLPLSGGCAVEMNDETYVLNDREEIWSAITDYLYIPRGTMFTVRNESGGWFALPATKVTRDLLVRYYPVTKVVTTLRSTGPCSRRVDNYTPGNDLETSHLLACEILIPDGNWSSYPSHKHDEHNEVERILEEVYYYKVRPGLDGSPRIALQRVYPSGHDIDVCAEVYPHGAMTMPHGYHGPSMAAPGYNLYYLNVMVGPAKDPTWLMTDGLAYTWIRNTWTSQDANPRLPVTPLN